MEKLDKKIEKIQKKILSPKNWTCLCPNCSQQTINSHLLQQHGILDNITENGHMFELKQKNIYDRSVEDEIFKFIKIGIKSAISWPLFCNRHDTELFKDIEGQQKLDCTNYRTQLLFSYRAVCAEIRKKQMGIRKLEMLEKCLSIPIQTPYFQYLIKGLEMGIEDFKIYKSKLEQEFKEPSKQFVFHHYSYPKLNIYASAVFGYIKYDNYAQKVYDKKPWENVFFHIIPQPLSTEIIIGYCNEFTNTDIIDMINEWKQLDPDSLGKKITELLMFHMQDWGLSPSLYKAIPESKKQQYLKVFEKNIQSHESSLRSDLNLFEGMIIQH